MSTKAAKRATPSIEKVAGLEREIPGVAVPVPIAQRSSKPRRQEMPTVFTKVSGHGHAEVLGVEAEDSHFKLAVDSSELEVALGLALPTGLGLISIDVDKNDVVLGGRNMSEVKGAPNRVLGLLAFSERTFSTLQQIAEPWEQQFGRKAPRVFLASTPSDRATLLIHVVESLLTTRAETARRNVLLMRDLTAVRLAHEHMQDSFRRLETYLAANNSLERTETLTLEAHRHSLPLSSGMTVSQRLPASSVGVSDVALHFLSTPTDATGKLTIQLLSLEDSKELGNWTIPAWSIPETNWLPLALQESLDMDERTLLVTASWEGAGEILLSLGPPHPEPKWCATTKAGSVDRTLALKVWRSLPNTRPAHLPDSVPSGKSVPSSSWAVPQRALQSVVQLAGPVDYIRYEEKAEGILVHPGGEAPTIGILHNACPSGAKHIAASIETRHPEAGIVEYALGVLPRQDKARKSKGTIPGFKKDYVTDWSPIKAGKASELHLFLPEALSETSDLYLLTRVAPNTEPSYCWATFFNLRAYSE